MNADGTFDQHATVLKGGKELAISDDTKEEVAKDMNSMLVDFVSGKIDKEGLDKKVKEMEEEINNSGIAPPGIDLNNPDSIKANSEVMEENIARVPDLESLSAEKALIEYIAQKLLAAEYAGRVNKALPNKEFMDFFDKSLDKYANIVLATARCLLDQITPAIFPKVQGILADSSKEITIKVSNGDADPKILSIMRDIMGEISKGHKEKLSELVNYLIDQEKFLTGLKMDGSENEEPVNL